MINQQAFFDEFIRFLKNPSGGTHAIHEQWSIVKKNIEMIQFLVQQGIDLNQCYEDKRDKNHNLGLTPLHIVAEYDVDQVIPFLIKPIQILP